MFEVFIAYNCLVMIEENSTNYKWFLKSDKAEKFYEGICGNFNDAIEQSKKIAEMISIYL